MCCQQRIRSEGAIMEVNALVRGLLRIMSKSKANNSNLFSHTERYGTFHPSTFSRTRRACTGENVAFALVFTRMDSGCLKHPTDIRMGETVCEKALLWKSS
jgi:hypothetical protein